MNLKRTTCRFVVLSLLTILMTVGGFAQGQSSTSADGDARNRLADILQKAGERVQRYTEEIMSVVCTEVTRQQELQTDMKTPKNKPTELTYDFITTRGSSGFGIRELRELKSINGKPAEKNAQPAIPAATAYTTALSVLLPTARA